MDGARLIANARGVKRHIGAGVKLCAMVKANGYGHGLTQTARLLLSEADWFGVATVREGMRLRAAGVEAPILLTSCTAQDAAGAVEQGLTATAFTENVLQELERCAERSRKRCAVHLKVDTGMNRLGVKDKPAFDRLLSAAGRCPRLDVTGCYTHFYSADAAVCDEQAARLTELSARLRKSDGVLVHAAASGGVLLDRKYHLDMVRCGILLYGYYPYESAAYPVAVAPCASLSAEIVSVKRVRRGECVSYNGTHVFQKDTTVAAVRLGYGDGVSRLLSNRGSVVIGGKVCPIVGNVCMDMLMADTNGAEPAIGEAAYLIAPEQTADAVAKRCGTISYEVLAGLTERVERKCKI